jgi:hypothetical protein
VYVEDSLPILVGVESIPVQARIGLLGRVVCPSDGLEESLVTDGASWAVWTANGGIPRRGAPRR